MKPLETPETENPVRVTVVCIEITGWGAGCSVTYKSDDDEIGLGISGYKSHRAELVIEGKIIHPVPLQETDHKISIVRELSVRNGSDDLTHPSQSNVIGEIHLGNGEGVSELIMGDKVFYYTEHLSRNPIKYAVLFVQSLIAGKGVVEGFALLKETNLGLLNLTDLS